MQMKASCDLERQRFKQNNKKYKSVWGPYVFKVDGTEETREEWFLPVLMSCA